MQLSDKQINEFQILWKKYCHEDIDKEQAIEKCLQFVYLIKLIYRPIKKSDLKN